MFVSFLPYKCCKCFSPTANLGKYPKQLPSRRASITSPTHQEEKNCGDSTTLTDDGADRIAQWFVGGAVLIVWYQYISPRAIHALWSCSGIDKAPKPPVRVLMCCAWELGSCFLDFWYLRIPILFPFGAIANQPFLLSSSQSMGWTRCGNGDRKL